MQRVEIVRVAGRRLALRAGIGHLRGVDLHRTLIAGLVDARAHLLALVDDLPDASLRTPLLAIVNPILWEIGHVGWFQERWTLRHLGRQAPIRDDADELWDSTAVAHDTRWELRLPSRAETLAFLRAELDAVIDRLSRREVDEKEAYFHRLVTFHEDMHGEALVYTRQTLGLPPPRVDSSDVFLRTGPCPGDVAIAGGTFSLGSTRDQPFVFDNEKWAHPVSIAPFRIARAPVTQGEFAEFVDAGGYRRDELWSAAGLRWRDTVAARHPMHWRRDENGRWMRVHFDRVVPLAENAPVLHVGWYEAEAFCNFSERRLPTEAEWECAASGEPGGGQGRRIGKRLFPWGNQPPDASRAHLDLRSNECCDVASYPAGDSAFGCRQMIGNVWEWTASDFRPYPGFVADPYAEYSEPWFGTHKVLRGGCFATRARLLRNTWRNFYTPDRRDVLAGFRTCAR